jgi:2-aminoethylphosphonate aminotransferase
MIEIKRNILLTPGPATTSESVKLSQVVPDICPREKVFGDLLNKIASDLISFVTKYRDDYTCVFFGGSGTAAVEALLSSVVPEDGKVLIVNNGAYGARMVKMAEIYNINYVEFKSSCYDPIDVSLIDDILSSDVTLTHLFMVHHETTSGLLNAIDGVGAVCVKHNVELAVDAMSSYAAVPIDMDRMNIQYMVASSNKNLQGMAGISFVIAKKGNIESIQSITPRSLYLSLYDQYAFYKKTNQLRFTPPVQAFYALRQAIEELKQEGVAHRYARYLACYERLIKACVLLKLTVLVNESCRSKLISTIAYPASQGFDFDQMYAYLYDRGVTIYPGKVTDKATFRVANIGDISPADMDKMIELLRQYLKGIQHI